MRWLSRGLLVAIAVMIFVYIFVRRDLVNVVLLIGTSAALWAPAFEGKKNGYT